MKKIKRITAVLISLILSFSAFSAVPLTVGAETYEDFEYEIYYSSDEYGNEYEFAAITGYNGVDSNLNIPITFDGYSVEVIESCAFYDGVFETVTIPSTITSIATDAFCDCTNLKSITVDSENEYYCSVNGVLYNKDMTEIITYPAASTATSYSIPDTVVTVDCTFSYCANLTTLTIPASVVSISASNIYNCQSLTAVNVDSANEYYCSVSGVLFNKDKTELVLYPEGKTATYYSIPSTVTTIGESSFSGCSNIVSVTIPSSVLYIYESAFYGCSNLEYISFPSTLLYVGSSAFQDTAWLENQSDGVIYAGNVAYKYKGEPTSNTTVTIADGTTFISDYAFAYLSYITEVTIPQSVKNIGTEAFSYCADLAKVNFNAANGDVAPDAFYGCDALTTVTFGSTVERIPDGAFADCGALTTVNVADSVKDIGYGAFFNTPWYENQADGVVYAGKVAYCYKGEMANNASITIKTGTTAIATSLFEGYDSLSRVTIPSSVTSIGKNAFAYCVGLTGITIPEGVETIDDGAFIGCGTITGVTIPSTVTYIGDYVFYDCLSLASVDVNSNNKSYCSVDGVLLNAAKTEIVCYPLAKKSTSYTVPDGVVTIGDTFAYNDVIQEIILPDSVTDIGYYTNCTALKTITIGSGAEDIDVSAFDGCSSLQSINISSSNLSYSSANGVLFDINKTELLLYPMNKMDSEYSIPATVETIRDYSFLNCSNLYKVVIPASVTHIGYGAFQNCENLNSIIAYAKEVTIEEYAFGYLLYYDENGEYIMTNNENLVITGFEDTEFEAYANENAISFGIVSDKIGDTNNDGLINIDDATTVQRFLLKNTQPDGEFLYVADTDHDAKITINDVTAIQRYCVKIITEF